MKNFRPLHFVIVLCCLTGCANNAESLLTTGDGNNIGEGLIPLRELFTRNKNAFDE